MTLAARLIGVVLVGATTGCVHRQPPTYELRVLYATDRTPRADGSYGSGRGDSLIYGTVPVSIWEKNGTRADSQTVYEAPKRVRVGHPEPLPRDSFFVLLRSEIRRRQYHQSFTYVHGFNNDFAAAIGRTALFERALDYRWVGVAYSWPSYNKVQYYVGDLDQARWTHRHLRDFFAEIAENTEADSHSVAAHSMGSQALSWALDTAVVWPGKRPHFAAIALLDPDIDPDLLVRDHLPALRAYARTVSLYGTPHDKALALARRIRAGSNRAGQLPPGHRLSDSIDVIDISGVKGHSFLRHFDHLRGTTLADLLLALWTGTPMRCRTQLGTADWDAQTRLWVLRPQWTSEDISGEDNPDEDTPACQAAFAEEPPPDQ